MRIVNRLSVPVDVDWVDFGGAFKAYYRGLKAGASYTQGTLLNHNWGARVNGFTVASYSASSSSPTWTIGA